MNITRGKIAKAQKCVIYGVEGIGKSTLASQFPNPLFIDTEGSTSNMDVGRMDNPSSWAMLNSQIDWIKKNKPCQTIVIDTIDWAERLAIDYVCSKSQKNSITDFGYGTGFIQLEEEFGRFLNRLSDLTEIGINVVLTAHAKIIKFEQPDEMGAYDRWELKLGNKTTAKTAALVKEWADMVLFCNYKTVSVQADKDGKKHKGQGGKRVMYTDHHPAWDAKNRFGLASELDMDFKAIAHIFASIPQTVQQPTQQPTPAVAQTVTPTVTVPNEPLITPPSQMRNQSEFSVLPQALQDLLKKDGVTPAQLRYYFHDIKGFFPKDTEFKNLPTTFIDGLVANWSKVVEAINENKEKIADLAADVKTF